MVNNRHNKYFTFQIILNIKIDSSSVSKGYFSYALSNNEEETEMGREHCQGRVWEVKELSPGICQWAFFRIQFTALQQFLSVLSKEKNSWIWD